MLQPRVREFGSSVPVCQLHQSFHLSHLATALGPRLRAEKFGLLSQTLSPFILLDLLQVSHKAFIYLIHFSVVLVLDLIELFHLLFYRLLNFLRHLGRGLGATLRDLMVSKDGSPHIALLST